MTRVLRQRSTGLLLASSALWAGCKPGTDQADASTAPVVEAKGECAAGCSYVDSKGGLHLVTDLDEIPARYQARAKRHDGKHVSIVPMPRPGVAAPPGSAGPAVNSQSEAGTGADVAPAPGSVPGPNAADRAKAATEEQQAKRTTVLPWEAPAVQRAKVEEALKKEDASAERHAREHP